jgi:hypothetical protein
MTVVMWLVQVLVWVWVQGELVQVLVQVWVGQGMVVKRNLRGQDYNITLLLRDSIPHESETLACGDAVRVW